MKKLCVSLALVLAAVGCTKKEDKPAPAPAGSGSSTTPTPTPAPSGSGSAVAEGSGSAAAGSAAAGSATADANADHVTVFSHHLKAQPKDPVKLEFAKFKVVKATFDPKKIEGGTATIELDLTSFKTDSDKRDAHVKSAAFLDTDKSGVATITVDNVKAKSGSTYSADASVVAHGITKKFPVMFDVVETADDHIKIKATHEFSRLDFGVGTDPAKDAEQQVATDLKIEMVLTIPKG